MLGGLGVILGGLGVVLGGLGVAIQPYNPSTLQPYDPSSLCNPALRTARCAIK